MAAVAAVALACADLKMATKRAVFDASMATNTTQEAYRKAQAAIETIEDEDERALGEAVALRIVASQLTTQVADGLEAGAGVRQSRGLELRDRDLATYVNNVGNLVALQGARKVFPPAKGPRLKARRFVFSILDTDQVGAYSTPGGYIFITRGLLLRLTSESELAWVLAHEIAHVDNEDGLAMLKTDLATRTAMGSLGEALKGKKEGESAFRNQEFFNAVVDRFYEVYEGTGLARDTELRADKEGIAYAVAAGYDGNGAARALENLDLGRSIGRFITHGSKRERLSAMEAMLEKPGKTGAARFDRMCLSRAEQLAQAGGAQ